MVHHIIGTGTNSEYVLGSVGAPLPVELSGFSAKNTPFGVNLSWQTTTYWITTPEMVIKTIID